MKSIFKVLSFVPLIIDLVLILLVTTMNKVGHVAWEFQIPIVLFLMIIGIGISSTQKLMKQIGNVALIALTIMLMAIGYYDGYFKWLAYIVAVIPFMYFILIQFFMKKFKGASVNNS